MALGPLLSDGARGYNRGMRACVAAACVVAACLPAACSAPPPMLPIVATPPATLPPLADVERACAFEVSCFHSPIASSIDECMDYLLAGLDDWVGPSTFFVVVDGEPNQYARWVGCADSGSDCASVLDCVSRGHDGAYCAAHPGNSCDGSLLVDCLPEPTDPSLADPALFTTDCAAIGMRCVDRGGGVASCSDGTTCAHSNPRCDGNRYFEDCDPSTHLGYRLDCSLSMIPDATCRAGASTGCLPSGPPCAGARCEGDVRVTCLDGEEVRNDCAERAMSCAVVNGAPTCMPVANDCSSDGACNGDAIVTCAAGMMQTVDCSALGLSTCATDTGGNPFCE